VSRVRSREGWISSYKPPHVSFAVFLRERLRLTIRDASYEPLEVVYGSGCAYVASRVCRLGRTTEVRIVVAQVEHLPGQAGESINTWRIHDDDRLGQLFTYSDGRRSYVAGLQATFGNAYSRCPRNVLEKLTDTTNPGALAWRQSCWTSIHELEARGRRPCARGDVLWLSEPMIFNDGVQRQSFLIVQSEPLSGISVGDGLRVLRLGPYTRLLVPAAKLDLDVIPTSEHVEILTASQRDCVGYLVRTTHSHRILGASNDDALTIAFERQWNSALSDCDFTECSAPGASP
jgi:hypothetical protein